MTKILYGNFENKFSRMRRNGFDKDLRALSQHDFFFMLILLSGCAISAFWKTHLCKLISNKLETEW